MSRIAEITEYTRTLWNEKEARLEAEDKVSFYNWLDYVADGGSSDYLEHCAHQVSSVIGKPDYLVFTRGWWLWRRFYKVWFLDLGEFDYRLFTSEIKCRHAAMLHGY